MEKKLYAQNKNISNDEICLIDSGICNLESVIRAFKRLDLEVKVSDKPKDLMSSKAVVLPGVGAFGDGMKSLRDKGLDEALQRVATNGKPILGICLGMQLLVECSEEHGNHKGLGLIPGQVRRLKPTDKNYRVPNIGWCDVSRSRSGHLFSQNYSRTPFYFVHSYYLDVEEEYVSATISFGTKKIPVAVEYDQIFGVQFHPEKSQDEGLNMLKNWVQYISNLDTKTLTGFYIDQSIVRSEVFCIDDPRASYKMSLKIAIGKKNYAAFAKQKGF